MSEHAPPKRCLKCGHWHVAPLAKGVCFCVECLILNGVSKDYYEFLQQALKVQP